MTETREAMTTVVTVTAIGPTDAVARRAIAAAWQEMDLSIFCLDDYRKPSEEWLKGDKAARKDPAQQPSDVWRINRDAGMWNTTVDPITNTCLSAAREVWQLSGGAFDPTVGPVVDLWRQAAKDNRLPTDDEIAAARALVDMQKVEILIADIPREPKGADAATPESGESPTEPLTASVHLVSMAKGMRLDLGGIAKGYIAGRMAQRMKHAGATAGLVAAAGDIFALGERPGSLAREGGERRWIVGVQDPRFPDDRARLYTRLAVRDMGVHTSGHYYRGNTIQGKRYSHIVDPRTGRPVDMHVASVTVVSIDPAVGDGLSTAIAVMGVEKGLAMVDHLTGVECLILEARLKEGQSIGPDGAPPPDAELVAHRSKGFAAMEIKLVK
ncbi:MAG: FAD:protein FMN transferase [Planctomycetota bacterium]|nr:FAD:protein FMN transferase [Planctomycetota bacterium]